MHMARRFRRQKELTSFWGRYPGRFRGLMERPLPFYQKHP